MKSAEEIMQVLEAFDLTGRCAMPPNWLVVRITRSPSTSWPKIPGSSPTRLLRGPMLIDVFLPKLEEWMEHSNCKIRADVAHGKLPALGRRGSERTARRAIA